MTPEEKAMTEKSIPVTNEEGPKVPLREDTFQLTNNTKPDDKEKKIETTKAQEKPELKDISDQALASIIDERLNKLSKVDFLTITFSKTGLFVAIGIILVLIWIIPLVNLGLIKVSGGKYSLANLRSDRIIQLYEPPVTPTPTSSDSSTKIRIRTNIDTLSGISVLETKLKNAGFTTVEAVYDPALTNNGVLIATRNNNEQLKQQLISALGADFQISSESASLTEDSDFAAALLIGTGAAIPTKE